MAAAYTQNYFSFVAVQKAGGHALLKARLRLSPWPMIPLPQSFSHGRVIAGAHALTDLNRQPSELLSELCEGKLQLPEGAITFTQASMGSYHVGFTPLHDEGLLSHNRISVLTIQGGEVDGLVQNAELDWSLKAASTPYDGIGELLSELGVGAVRPDGSVIEVVAETVAFIDPRSRLDGTDASIVIRAAEGLKPEELTVGYRILKEGRAVKRELIDGSAFTWRSEPPVNVGEVQIEVPLGSAVHCIVSCRGVAQHQYYLLDPSRLPNAMRTAFETFDDRLASITTILDNAEGRSYEARDLEAAVSWILAMHGFITVHMGGTRKQIAGPDNLAMAPSGNFAIIECTTKHLGSDKKLPDLVANAEKLRRKLDAAGQQHRSILRVLVTSLRAKDIAAELADAEKLGVLVLTRENLDDLVSRSITVPDADRLYEEGVEAVRTALEKTQP